MSSALANPESRTLIDEVAGRVSPHDERTLSWREQGFLGMGFDTRDALALAKTRIDLHHMQDLLGRGCPHAIAWAILVDTCSLGEDTYDYTYEPVVVDDEDDGA